MRFPLPVLGAVVVLLGGLAAAGPATAAGVPTAPYTALSVAGSAGSDPSVSQAREGGASTSLGDQVHIEYTNTDRIFASGFSEGGAYLAVTAPTGTVLTAGTSFPVQEQADATHGGVFLSSVAQGCRPRVVGTVSVVDLTVDADGIPTSAGLDVSTTCDDGRYTGVFRWKSDSPWTGVSLQPGSPSDNVRLGDHLDTPVTLTASGTTGLPQVTAVDLSGDDVDSFSVLDDGCTGVTLRAGKSCTVLVRRYPREVGDLEATLTLVHAGDTPYEVRLGINGLDVGNGTYHPLSPQRVLDTRQSIRGGVPTGGTVHLDTDLYEGFSASAFVLNITVDHPAGPGYLTAYPSGTPRPRTSSINFPTGWQGANLVTVPVGTNDGIEIYNGGGRTPIIADVVGYYAKADQLFRSGGGGYHATAVERILDTRTWGHGQLKGQYYATIPIKYQDDGGHIAALSVTVTAVNTKKQGYLTTWDGDSRTIPYTSTLNFGPNTGVISNAAIVPTSYCPDDECSSYATIGVLNQSSAPMDVVVDVNGFFDDGRLPAAVRYRPLATPTRIVDTRTSLGTTTLGPGTTRTVTAPTSVAGDDTIALDANITAVAPTLRTFVTAWPTFDDYPRPLASVLNPLQGQTIADHAIAEVGYGNRFNLFNATGRTDLLVDVSGTFELFPPTPPDQQQTKAARAAPAPPRRAAAPAPAVHRG